MKIVTNGSVYVDIDAYGGVIAYAELLRAQGYEAAAVSTVPLNESISATVRSWKAPLQTTYTPSPEDTFIAIDLSDPDFFDKIVDLERVEGVIDHHVGFEKYWQEKIGDKARIEFIGAACTLVYESWVEAGLLEQMSETSARVLICGILDNTLNFGALVTTKRDQDAYEALLKIANLPDDWKAQYFSECQASIIEDIGNALKNDTKIPTFNSFDAPVCFGQLTVWDAQKVLSEKAQEIATTLSAIKPKWFLNLISVSERKSYFVSDNKNVQRWLSGLLDIQFEGSTAIADRLWLRKEVIKHDNEQANI